MSDPLAGYTPDWRERARTPRPDPLAGYTPDWRTRRRPLLGQHEFRPSASPPPTDDTDTRTLPQVGYGLRRGLSESGYASAIGLGQTAEALGDYAAVPTNAGLPGAGVVQGLGALARRALPALERSREEDRQFGPAITTTAGRVAEVGGRLAGDIAQYAATGGAVRRLAGLATPRRFAARALQNVITGAPLDVIGAQERENSQTAFLADLTGNRALQNLAATRGGRTVGDVATSGAAGILLEELLRGRRAFRADRPGGAGVPRTPPPSPPDPGMERALTELETPSGTAVLSHRPPSEIGIEPRLAEVSPEDARRALAQAEAVDPTVMPAVEAATRRRRAREPKVVVDEWAEADRAAATARASGEGGAAHPDLVRGIAGSATGATIGATQGDTTGERIRNAALGAVAGAGVPGAARVITRDMVQMARRLGGLPALPTDQAGRLRLFHGTPHTFEPEAVVRFRDGRRINVPSGEALPEDVVAAIRTGEATLEEHPLGRFRMDKIGAGEGAQAYGHGLYFTESRGVAEHYRAAGSPAYRNAGVRSIVDEAMAEARKVASREADVRRLAREWIHQQAMRRPEYARRQWFDAINNLDAILDGPPPGRLYTADIDADPDDFLDWDRPLSEQSPKVREAVRRALGRENTDSWLFPSREKAEEAARGRFREGEYRIVEQPEEGNFALYATRDFVEPRGHFTGERIYSWLTQPGGVASASATLRKAGIKGIRYADGSSRALKGQLAAIERELAEGARNGEYGGRTRPELLDKADRLREQIQHNYVVFDDDAIRVAERGATLPSVTRGLAGAGAGAATGAALDDEHRGRGALLGAAVGAGSALAPEIGRALRGADERGAISLAPSAREVETAAEAVPEAAGAAGRPPRPPRAAAPVDPGAVNPEEHVRLAKFALDPRGEERLRGEVQRVAARYGLDPKRPVTWDETRRLAATLGLDPSDLVRRPGRLSGAEMLAARNLVSDNTRELVRIGDRLAAIEAELPTATVEAGAALRQEQATLRETQQVLEMTNDRLLGRFIRERSQTGRDLNNLKILAHTSLDPTAWLGRARTLRGGPLLAEEAATVARLVAEARQSDAARVALVRYVSRLRRAPLIEKALTIWKAGLLTAPTTHLANQVGNASMAALETAKDAPAAMFDLLFSLASGTRTKGGVGLGTVAASWKGARAGLRDAVHALRSGAPVDALRRYDLTREVVFDGIPVVSPLLNIYTQGVYRAMSAGDRIWRGIALHRSLREQAGILAKRTGQSIADVLAHPPDDVMLRAIADAEVATFNDQTLLATAALKLRDAFGPAGHVALPFARTPANVATRIVEYSGGGLVSGLWRLLRAGGDVPPALQRQIAEELGRGSLGALAVLAGYALAAKGRARGAGPQPGSGAYETDQLLGRPAYAVLVNGTWRDVRRVSPVGNLIGFGATLYEIGANPDLETRSVKVAAGAGALGRQVIDQSSLAGVTSLLQSVQDPVNAGQRFGQRLAGSVVPTIVARTAQAIDPTVRQPRTAGEAIQARLPGFTGDVPARVDQFGQEVRRDRVEPAAVQVLADFSNPRRDRTADDPVRAALASTGATISAMHRRPAESPEAFRARQERAGVAVYRMLERVVGSTAYQRASPEDQRWLLERAAADVRADVTAGRRVQFNPYRALREREVRERRAARSAARA